MSSDAKRFYEFGEFRLDARKRLLLKNGEQTQISPRILDLLLVLVQNEGEILTHDDLLDQVWDGAFVEQSNLKKSVSALRQILGEHPDERVYVKTVPRRGYSFVAPVRVVDEEPEAVYLRETHTEIIVEEVEDDDVAEKETLRLPTARTGVFLTRLLRNRVALAAILVVLIAVAGLTLWSFRARSKARFDFENVKITKLTSVGSLTAAIVSPDGKYFVYAAVESGGTSLWLKQLGRDTKRFLSRAASRRLHGAAEW